MPGEGLTHGPPAEKKQAAVTTGSAGSSGIPCAMVLRLIRDLPGEPGFLAPVARHHLASLTPASGCQDHTISPSAKPRSSASATRREPYVHRIPASRSVTIGQNALLIEGDSRIKSHNSEKRKRNLSYWQRTVESAGIALRSLDFFLHAMGVVEAARVAQGPRHWFPRLPVGRITPDQTGVIQESPNPLEVLSHRASGGRAACRYSILDCVSDWATNRIWNSVPTIAQCWIGVAAIYYAIDLARQTRVGWSDGRWRGPAVRR